MGDENQVLQISGFEVFQLFDCDHCEKDFWILLIKDLFALLIWTVTYIFIKQDFPGHSNGKMWPLYVPDLYGERNSQYLLDPYR